MLNSEDEWDKNFISTKDRSEYELLLRIIINLYL